MFIVSKYNLAVSEQMLGERVQKGAESDGLETSNMRFYHNFAHHL